MDGRCLQHCQFRVLGTERRRAHPGGIDGFAGDLRPGGWTSRDGCPDGQSQRSSLGIAVHVVDALHESRPVDQIGFSVDQFWAKLGTQFESPTFHQCRAEQSAVEYTLRGTVEFIRTKRCALAERDAVHFIIEWAKQ